MKNEIIQLRGEDIYASELKQIAKANKIEFKDRETADVIADLTAIAEDKFVMVNPANGKAIKDPNAAIIDLLTKQSDMTTKEIADATFLPIKTVSTATNELFAAGKIIRVTDKNKMYRYSLDGVETNSEKKTEMKPAKTKKAAAPKKVASKKEVKPKAEKKAAKPKKEKAERLPAMTKEERHEYSKKHSKFKEDQKVNYTTSEGRPAKGTVVSSYLSYHSDKIIVRVRTSDSKIIERYETKITKAE